MGKIFRKSHTMEKSGESVLLMLILSLLIFNCDLVLSVKNSKFLSVSTHVSAYENETVVLPCTYHGK